MTRTPGQQHIVEVNTCAMYFPTLIKFFTKQKQLLKKLDDLISKRDSKYNDKIQAVWKSLTDNAKQYSPALGELKKCFTTDYPTLILALSERGDAIPIDQFYKNGSEQKSAK